MFLGALLDIGQGEADTGARLKVSQLNSEYNRFRLKGDMYGDRFQQINMNDAFSIINASMAAYVTIYMYV